MLKNLAFLVLLSTESVWFHHALFADKGFSLLSAFIVFFQGFVVFSLLLTLKRLPVAVFLSLESLMFLALIAYHKYYADPLTLSAVFGQINEGAAFAVKSPLSLFNGYSMAVLALWLFKIAFVKKYYQPFSDKWIIRGGITALLLFFVFMTHKNYGRQWFSINDFNRYVRELGYPQGWWYEAMMDWDKKALTRKVLSNAARPEEKLNKELSQIKPVRNVFIVQVESLDREGMFKIIDGKAVMPFLRQLSEKSLFYTILPHDKKASANSDFSMLTGTGVYNDSYSGFYMLLPPSVYEKIGSVPQMLKEKGWHTAFYHGYKGWFFNREKHIDQMGFGKVFFEDNLPLTSQKGEWGFDDKDLFAYVLKTQTEKKNFNFVITVSSHESFNIGERHKKLVAEPQNLKDKYFNALNYVDEALQMLVEQAPEDSLFIIYSDHHSGITEDKRTVFLIYGKNQSLKLKQDAEFNNLPPQIKILLMSF